MRHLAWLVLLAVGLHAVAVGAQDHPDLSGRWVVDTSRSDTPLTVRTLTITQTPRDLTMAQEYFNRDASAAPLPLWTLRLNQWGPGFPPRAPGQNVKLVQSRWDGQKLITVAGPGMCCLGSSFLLIWRLDATGRELLEERIGQPFPTDFDFKETSIPSAFTRHRRIYVRQTQ
jgi:hypothetical protein